MGPLYIKKWWGDWINYKPVVYKQKVTLNVQLNDMAVGRTKLGKTQRMNGLLYAAFKVTSYNLSTFTLLIEVPY
jgi:hypothetical protein